MGRGARWLRDFRGMLADRGGNAAMMFGLAVLPLMGATGLAVDTARGYSVEDRLQKALDSAALAAGRTLDTSNIESDARSFLDANFGDAAEITDLDVTPSEDNSRITVTATAEVPTSFMSIFGEDTMTVRARTVVQRQTTGMELALVLDITGSMLEQNKIGSLKTAAHELINILYGDRETVPNLWVSVVPYIASVNVGTANLAFLASNDRARVTGSTSQFAPTTWGGCVLARGSGRDRTDDPPSTAAFSSYLYPDTGNVTTVSNSFFWNDWKAPRNPAVSTTTATWSSGAAYWTGWGPNVGCPAAITPLVAQRTTVRNAINALKPWYKGGTVINEGLVWGWRSISPRWRNLWSGGVTGMPLDYNTPNMRKVIVLLTDGDNQMPTYDGLWPYNAYAGSPSNLGQSTQSGAESELNRRTTTVCTNVKAQGITVYTITFGSVPSSTGQSLMRGCASRPEYYFHSPNGTALRTAFQMIGQQLSSLRIVE
jgi:Flp pilus assembly protein TadG